MTNVVFVLLVEFVVVNFMETPSPEHETFLEIQPDAFEEERVLQTAKVLEMGISAK